MGFAVSYRSSRPVSTEDGRTIVRAALVANQGRSWLSCEPVFLSIEPSGHISGSSKPNFLPDPRDAASAVTQVLPDGTLRDVVGILCKLSVDHDVEWEISHDYETGVIGFIRGGMADEQMLEEIEALADLGDVLSDLGDDQIG
jgi:hypothetical protein